MQLYMCYTKQKCVLLKCFYLYGFKILIIKLYHFIIPHNRNKDILLINIDLTKISGAVQ